MVTEHEINNQSYKMVHEVSPNRARNSSAIRKKKGKRNGDLMRRSMSCDEIAMYRNRAMSPVWKDVSAMRPKNKTQRKDKKKSSNRTSTRERCSSCSENIFNNNNTNKVQRETKKKTKQAKKCSISNMIDERTRKPFSEHNTKPAMLTKKIYFPTNSLLHYAVSEGDLELVERLLADDARDIDSLSIEGTAPIHEAAVNGDLSCIKLLLNYGASLETVDISNRTAVEYAVLAGHFDSASLLLNLGASDEKIRHGVPCS